MNKFQDIFDAQKALFASGITRTHEWRVDQLDRMARMIRENEGRFQKAMAKDFKTASQEYMFETGASAGESEVQKSQLKEWMKPVEATIPRFLAKTGHKGLIYREPYGVALIIGPFNGPLLLLIRPALAALAAGNTCILTLSEALPATTEVLLELVPKYFDPSAVTAVPGGKETNTELLKLPNDFIFFNGSTFVGKIVARAAAETLTPVLLELGGMNPAVVDATANIPDAAKKIVWGAMAWGGQWCTSPGYAYVQEPLRTPSSPRPKRHCWNCSVTIQNPIPTIRGSSTRARSIGWPRSSTPLRSSPAASRIGMRTTSIPRFSIPSRGTTRSWTTRSSVRSCRF